MGPQLTVDLIAKVLVAGYHNPILGKRQSDNFLITDSTRRLEHRENVMPLASQPASHGRPGIFVYQKAHQA